jgi:hypothetical protein
VRCRLGATFCTRVKASISMGACWRREVEINGMDSVAEGCSVVRLLESGGS